MANTIKIKSSGTVSAVPSALEHGELGLNYADGKVFYKNASNTIVEFGSAGAQGIQGETGPAGETGATGATGAEGSIGIPSGSIQMYAASTTPSGWLSCDGAAVSRTTYAALFAVIGTTYGAGDGSTTFALPNIKGRVPVGLDSTQTEFDALGETGGAKTHTLTVAEMPSHTHTQNSHNHTQDAHGHNVNDPSHTHGLNPMGSNPGDNSGTNGYVLTGASIDTQGGGRGIAGAFTGISVNGNTATNQAATATNQNTGGGGAHNNLQPYIVLNYIIKA